MASAIKNLHVNGCHPEYAKKAPKTPAITPDFQRRIADFKNLIVVLFKRPDRESGHLASAGILLLGECFQQQIPVSALRCRFSLRQQ